MKQPKFKPGDTVDCEQIVGFIDEVFVSTRNPEKFLYAVEEPESESLGFYLEEELV